MDASCLLKTNRKLYALYQMVALPMTLGDPNHPKHPHFVHFNAFHISVTAEGRDFKFGGSVNHRMSQPANDKLSLKGGVVMVTWPILGIYTPLNISETAEARVVKFCVAVGQVLTFGQLIDPERGVARVTWLS